MNEQKTPRHYSYTEGGLVTAPNFIFVRRFEDEELKDEAIRALAEGRQDYLQAVLQERGRRGI